MCQDREYGYHRVKRLVGVGRKGELKRLVGVDKTEVRRYTKEEMGIFALLLKKKNEGRELFFMDRGSKVSSKRDVFYQR